MSCGIYKITNLINNKVYIGQSQNIEQRWISHKYESINSNQDQYNYSIHRAFRKYGLDNFSFSIIELTEKDKLNEREKYWISFFDSFKNGYNETEGGDTGPSMPGEKNPNALLTEQDVINIRTQLLNGKMRNEVYQEYANRISLRGFEHIWQGDCWTEIMPEAIQYVKSPEYISKIKSYASKSRNKENREKILLRKSNGEKRLDVYKDFQQIYSLSGFNKVWYTK